MLCKQFINLTLINASLFININALQALGYLLVKEVGMKSFTLVNGRASLFPGPSLSGGVIGRRFHSFSCSFRLFLIFRHFFQFSLFECFKELVSLGISSDYGQSGRCRRSIYVNKWHLPCLPEKREVFIYVNKWDLGLPKV